MLNGLSSNCNIVFLESTFLSQCRLFKLRVIFFVRSFVFTNPVNIVYLLLFFSWNCFAFSMQINCCFGIFFCQKSYENINKQQFWWKTIGIHGNKTKTKSLSILMTFLYSAVVSSWIVQNLLEYNSKFLYVLDTYRPFISFSFHSMHEPADLNFFPFWLSWNYQKIQV